MAKKITTEEFIKKAKEIHGDKYDYSKTDLDNRDEKGRVCIICPIHGEFWQLPIKHVNCKQGCGKCKGKKISKTKFSNKKEFIKKARKIHGDKYNYDKVIYNGNKINVIITCPIHGDFEMTPNDHLTNGGCKYCKGKSLHIIDFIKRSNEKHHNKYDYSKTDLNNRDEKGRVCIICPIHGEFYLKPNKHLEGRGCQKCGYGKNIKENELKEILINTFKNIDYQKKFDWLGLQSLDFYLPKYNIGIECQGEQHFKSIEYFGGEEKLKNQIERDYRKIKLCEQNGVKLLHFTFLKEKEFENCGYEVINDVDKLISIIKESVE